MILGEQSKDDGSRTGRKVVDVVKREWPYHKDKEQRWKQNGIG